MTKQTEKAVKTLLETLVNQIEENGLMQYDMTHNGEYWVLDVAKELLARLSAEESTT